MKKVVIVGCGLISEKEHIPAFLRIKDKAVIVALCDLNEDLAKKLALKFGIKKYYSDFSNMLLQEKPDIVDMCTPPQTHAKLAIQALDNGAHVLIEKPMALSVLDCNLMLEAATKNNKKLGIIHNQLFNPAIVKAKEIIESGEMGNFLGMQVFLSTPTDYMTSVKDHWVHKLPGGVLGETGPHSVYLASAFLKNIYDVDICTRKILPHYTWSTYEDIRFNLISKNGICSVTQFYGNNQWAATIEILCTEGILKIDLQAKSIIKYNRPELSPVSLGVSLLKGVVQVLKMLVVNSISYFLDKRNDAHSIAISEFVESVLTGKPFMVEPNDGREVVRVMEMLVSKLNNNVKESILTR